MQLTQSNLKQLINEELTNLLREEVAPEVEPIVDIEDPSKQNIFAHDARLDFIEGFLKREFPEFKPGREEW